MLRACLLVLLTGIVSPAQPASAQMDSTGLRPGARVLAPQIARQAAPVEGQDSAQSSSALADSLTFVPSAQLRQQIYERFVQQGRQADPGMAQALETAFRADPIGQWEPMLAALGLRTDNVADAYAVLWMKLWQAAHGAGDNTSRTMAQAVRWQAATAMIAIPAMQGADDAGKQDLADTMLVQAMLIGMMHMRAGSDPAQLAALQQQARDGGRELGLDLDAMALTEAGFVPESGGAPVAAPAASAPASAPAPQGGPGDETALTEALAAVPAEARPVQVVLHGEGSFLGWPPAYVYTVTTHLLFANGWATRCADWDPGVLRPTPESLGRAYPDCGLSRWRRSGGAVQLQAEDGSWGDPIPVEDAPRGFTPGERIDIAFGNVGGIGFAGAPGAVSVNSLGGSDLRLTPAGQVAIGSWSSVVVSADNIGGGGSSESRPLTGRYRLDGNLIAIQDESGAITRGFIAGVPGTGALEHVYLNGKQFWQDDD